MATPEGKVKTLVKRVLDKHKGLYIYWPVPGGYGPSSLDCLLCVGGLFVAIETKAPGKKPTKRQAFVIDQIKRSAGEVFVIDGEGPELERLDKFLGDYKL